MNSFNNFRLFLPLRILKKSLFLNTRFYLLVNPDVAGSKLIPRIHYFKYGFYENRVYSKSKCELHRIKKWQLGEIYELLSIFLVNDYLNLVRAAFEVNLPWRIGCFGFPAKLIRIDLKGYVKVDNKLFINIDQKFYSTYNLFINSTSIYLTLD